MDEAIMELDFAVNQVEEAMRFTDDRALLQAVGYGVVLALKREKYALQQADRRDRVAS